MNTIVLMGRLTRDPEIRYTQSEKVCCQFTMAVDRPYTNNGQKEADFIPVVLWGKQAEVAGNSLAKGHRVLVEGRLQIRSYEAKDGSKRYVAEVIGNRFDFIEQKQENTSAAVPASTEGYKEVKLGFNEEIPF